MAVRYLAWFAHTTPSGLMTTMDHDLARPTADGHEEVPLVSSSGNVRVWSGYLGGVLALTHQAYRDYFGAEDDAGWINANRRFSLVPRL